MSYSQNIYPRTLNQQSLQAIQTINQQCRRPTLFHSSICFQMPKSTQQMEQQIHLKGQIIECRKSWLVICQPNRWYHLFVQTHDRQSFQMILWLISPWSCCFLHLNSLTSLTSLALRGCLWCYSWSGQPPIGLCCYDRRGRLERSSKWW